MKLIKTIDATNIEALATGAKLLGSGGGGEPNVALEAARALLKQKAVNIINEKDLKESDLILPVAFVGSLQKLHEDISFTDICRNLLAAFERFYGKKPDAILAGEIGGMNGIFPIIMAAISGLPLLDGDMSGRAFPELPMASPNIVDVPCSPAFLCNTKNYTAVLIINDPKDLENVVRAIATTWDKSLLAITGFYPMNGKNIQGAIVRESISKAVALGEIILSRKDVINSLCKETRGQLVFSGRIVDIEMLPAKGFLAGIVTITDESGAQCKIRFKNEYFALHKNDEIIAETPDIISVFDSKTHISISSESLTVGTEVSVLTFKADDVWYTPKGLKLVGPSAFGA